MKTKYYAVNSSYSPGVAPVGIFKSEENCDKFANEFGRVDDMNTRIVFYVDEQTMKERIRNSPTVIANDFMDEPMSEVSP